MNKLIRKLTIALTLVLVPAAAAAQETPVHDTTTPQTPVTAEVPKQSTRDRVIFLLSGYEYFPTRADLDAVAPAEEVSSLLRDLASDVDGRPTQRLRAVDALGYYDDDATVELLTKLVTETPKADLPRRKLRTAGLLRHHAITSLVQARKAEAIPIIEPILMGDDVQLTLTAIHALGKHTGKDGHAALRQLIEASNNKVVVREAQKWLR